MTRVPPAQGPRPAPPVNIKTGKPVHEHEWQPAGVTTQGSTSLGTFVGSTYVWGMCKCGEITVRQWDS